MHQGNGVLIEDNFLQFKLPFVCNKIMDNLGFSSISFMTIDMETTIQKSIK